MAVALTEIIENDNGVQYVVDTETGELVEARVPGFTVDSPGRAEWLLERLSDLDAQIGAIDARKAALSENLDLMRKRVEARRDGLLFKFKPGLESVAKINLPPGKKSWVCPFGSVSFRTQPARLKVSDPERALEWAKVHAPDTVKVTEEFQISKLDTEAKEKFMDPASNWHPTDAGLDITLEVETAKVETGIR